MLLMQRYTLMLRSLCVVWNVYINPTELCFFANRLRSPTMTF